MCQQITGTTDPRRLHFTLLRSAKYDYLCGNSINKLQLRDEGESVALLGVLNSTIADWVFRRTSTNNHVQVHSSLRN